MQPDRSYLVCATPRSGSTFFCEALGRIGIAGRPKEFFERLRETGLPRQPQQYFEGLEATDIFDVLGGTTLRRDAAWLELWDGPSYADYLVKVLAEGTSPNGVFGTKMMWGYFDHFLAYLRDVSPFKDRSTYELLAATFPRLHYIWVTRRDKVRQAISLWKAIQTQRWRQGGAPNEANEVSEPTAAKRLVFHFAAIQHLEQMIIANEASWQLYFNEGGIQPLIVVYEDLIGAFEETLQRTLQYLGIPVPQDSAFVMPQMERQADALSEQWVQRYHRLKQGLPDIPEGSVS